MRSDFIGDCDAFLDLPEEVSRCQFLVPRLNSGQMKEAIERPGKVDDLGFAPFAFEDGLVRRIIAEAGDRLDQLPLMQHALMRTWKMAGGLAAQVGSALTLTHNHYESAGGIAEALSKHADAAWATIEKDPAKANLTRRLFLLLSDVHPDGKIVRRRPLLSEVQAITGADIPAIEETVRLFQSDDRNFLLPPLKEGEHLTEDHHLDISHEALLRQWTEFGKWLIQEAEWKVWLHELSQAAKDYEEDPKTELWKGNDLRGAEVWMQEAQPSGAWARRHGVRNWDACFAFLERSRAEVKREEEQRQKLDRHKRVRVQALIIILFVATGVSVWLMVKARRAEEDAVSAKVSAEKDKAATASALVRAVKAENAATDQAKNAIEAKAAAQEALTRSFVRTIGVSDEVEPDERAALWELAELDPANEPVREKVIDHWFRTSESLGRALQRHAQGLHAAVGLNLAVRNYSASKATEMADALVKALENPQETDDYRLSSLGQALAALAARMEPKGRRTRRRPPRQGAGESAGNRLLPPVQLARRASSAGSPDGAQGRRTSPTDPPSCCRKPTSTACEKRWRALAADETNAEPPVELGHALAALADEAKAALRETARRNLRRW